MCRTLTKNPIIGTPARLSPCRLLPFKNALSPKAILLWWKCSRPICHRSATVGSYIQYVRYDETNLESDILDERRFTGDLPTSLRTLDAFVQTLFPSRPVPLSALREEQVTPYPQWAIRELLMNAVMHRDYQSNAPIRFYQFSDRIEIQNPGGLYGAAADFPHQNDYRNPKIAEVMKNLAYVNRFGRGIATVQADLHTNGNQPAEFDISQTTFFLRSSLIAADYVISPLAPDLYSLQGLKNLGPALRTWRSGWEQRLGQKPDNLHIPLPSGAMTPAGYIVMQHS